MKLGAADCMEAVFSSAVRSSADVLAMLQYMSPHERVPHSIHSVMKYLAEVPAVIDWLQRSACRRGATAALSLAIAHFPEDFDAAEVTSGFPSETGEVTEEEVQALMAKAAPYADRVLAIAGLHPYQASATAPEDAEEGTPEHRDLPAERPFEAAQKKELTTFPVNKWSPEFRLFDDKKGSADAGSSAGAK